jgi:hypothetical protein
MIYAEACLLLCAQDWLIKKETEVKVHLNSRDILASFYAMCQGY